MQTQANKQGEIIGVVGYNGYADVKFRSEVAIDKCIVNLSIMTGERTWFKSTKKRRRSSDMGELRKSTNRNPRPIFGE